MVKPAPSPRLDLTEETKTLATIMAHREIVADNLLGLSEEFTRRARRHDRSKLKLDELAGFVRINQVARAFPYGSTEYKESLKSENHASGCIALHNKRNSHHPEHHKAPEEMGLLDLMEMVCDWDAAAKTYGQSTLKESLVAQRKRFDRFTPHQWWLIEQLAALLSAPEPADP